MNKYTYYRVIQTNHGYGWDDDDFHETDSAYFPKDWRLYKTNLKAYRENVQGGVRVIKRRELKNG